MLQIKFLPVFSFKNNLNISKTLNICHDSMRGGEGVDTNWDGHHDGGVVGRVGKFLLSENALSGQ